MVGNVNYLTRSTWWARIPEELQKKIKEGRCCQWLRLFLLVQSTDTRKSPIRASLLMTFLNGSGEAIWDPLAQLCIGMYKSSLLLWD